MYRDAPTVCATLARYRRSGGGRAIVSTIPVAPNADLGELRDMLHGFADAGFDDAVVLLLPGAPAAAAIRKQID